MKQRVFVIAEVVGEYEDKEIEVNKVLVAPESGCIDMIKLRQEYNENYSSFTKWLISQHGFEEAAVLGTTYEKE